MMDRRYFLKKMTFAPAIVAFPAFAMAGSTTLLEPSLDTPQAKAQEVFGSVYDTVLKHGDANDIIRLLSDPNGAW